MEFTKVGVCRELANSCAQMGWETPTDIQRVAIPPALEGKDVIGISQTGSGKTAAFALPVLQKLLRKKPHGYLKILVLSPTRELAVQVADHFTQLGSSIKLKVACITGGAEMEQQLAVLSKRPHVVVGTPGRINDLLQNKKLYMNSLEYLIIDEADKMLDFGFAQELDGIFSVIPKTRQTLLFSATMTAAVDKLQRATLREAVRCEVGGELGSARTVSTLSQYFVLVPYQKKQTVLLYLIQKVTSAPTWEASDVLVFCDTCQMVRRLTFILKKWSYTAIPLAGDMSQERRQSAIQNFANPQSSSDSTRILVCTDIGSRGLDMSTVDCVINYSVPQTAKDYIHQVGRTARAGRKGTAISIISQYDAHHVLQIEKITKVKMQKYEVDTSVLNDMFFEVDQVDQKGIELCKKQAARKQAARTTGKKRKKHAGPETAGDNQADNEIPPSLKKTRVVRKVKKAIKAP